MLIQRDFVKNTKVNREHNFNKIIKNLYETKSHMSNIFLYGKK